MGTLAGPGVGARSFVEICFETTWGVMPAGDDLGGVIVAGSGRAMLMTSESVQLNVGELVSASLNPLRGVKNTIRGNSDAGGDINFEFSPDWMYSNMLKQASTEGASLGAAAAGTGRYMKVAGYRGDLGLQVQATQAVGAATLLLKGDYDIANAWPTPAANTSILAVQRDSNGYLVGTNSDQWDGTGVGAFTANTNGLHTLTFDAVTVNTYMKNAWVFPGDSVAWANAYLHYFELGPNLPVGLCVDIMRDISLFVYTGMKINTVTMNMNAGEIVNGTFGMLGKEENCGGKLLAEVENLNAANLSISDIRIFNDGVDIADGAPQGGSAFGDMLIGHEGGVAYTGLALAASAAYPYQGTITFAGASITLGTDPVTAAPGLGYFTGTPVSPETTRANDGAGNAVDLQAAIPDVPPYSYFEGQGYQYSGYVRDADSYGVGDQEFEIVNATFTLDNGLFTDKFVLGSRFRAMLPEQQRNVTGTLTFEFDNLLQYRKFYDGTEFAFDIRLVSQDTQSGWFDGGTENLPYSSVFYFAKCKYNGTTPNADGPDLIITDFPFRSTIKSGVSGGTQGANFTGSALTDEMSFTELTYWTTTDETADFWA